jgi:tetratricopeptide (TPR) repeat protein
MDTVTYPNEKVSDFINKNVVPLRIPSDQKPHSGDYNIQWTPALMIIDQNGKEHHRTVGFIGPEELIPSILFGVGKAHFNNDRFSEALACYGKIIEQYPKSDSVEEAIFQTGVSRYKSTNNPMPLKEAYEKLKAEYPAGQWTKRAYPYRLIK